MIPALIISIWNDPIIQVFCCTWNMGEVEPVGDIIHLFDDVGDHICGFSNQGKVAHDIYAIGWSIRLLLIFCLAQSSR